MEKENKTHHLFSNGTECMVWQENNCEKCVKAVFYREKFHAFPKYRCAIQREIEFASVSDGCGSQRAYEATHKALCPYRQTERKKYNKVEQTLKLEL